MKPSLVFILTSLSLLLIIFYSISVNYSNGYFYYHESGKYLVNYLTDKPFLEKIFDFRYHDAEYYRPRELGNIFNWLDANLLLLMSKLRLTNFLSPVHYLSMFLISLIPILIVLRSKNRRISVLGICALLGLLYLTSPSPFLTANYFRTSKSVLSVFISIYFWILFVHNHKKLSYNFLTILSIGILSFSMGIVDEIGIILSFLFSIYLLIDSLHKIILYKKIVLLKPFIASAIGLVLIYIYRNFLGPMITSQVVGFYPTLWGTTKISGDLLSQIPLAIDVLLSYFGFLYGGVRGVILIPIFIFTIGIFVCDRFDFSKSKIFKIILATLTITFIVLGIFVLGISLMLLNLPNIALEESRFIYYPLPFVTTWFLLISGAILILMRKVPKIQIVLYMLLPALIMINIIKLNDYNQVTKSWWRTNMYYGAAFPIIAAINVNEISEQTLSTIPGAETIVIFRKKLGK